MPSSASSVLGEPPATVTTFVLWPLPDLREQADEALGLADAAGPDAEERAYQRGLEDGQRRTREEGERELRAAHEAFAALSHALQQAHTAWSEALEGNLHALAVAVARHVIEEELKVEPEVVRGLVRRAVDLVEGPGPITVRVHPDDVAALAALQAAAADDDRPALVLQPDPTIGRGGCVVETPSRLVDGRVETALLALYHRLRNG